MQNVKSKQSFSVLKLTQISILFAISIVLMFLESLIPPIPSLPPGIKLGLSNIIVMYCIFFMGTRFALCIAVMKALFVLMTRGIIASLMSAGGGLLSVLIMFLLLLLKKKKLSYIMLSMFGAVSHNIGQLIIACLILQNKYALYYAPVLTISGVAVGVITGIILRVTIPALGAVGSNKLK